MKINKKIHSVVIGNTPNSKSVYFNYRKTAYSKIIYHVVHVLGYKRNGLKINVAIRIFATHYGMQLDYPLELWLIRLYLSNDNDIIKRNDSTFYSTKEWRKLRIEVLSLYGTRCMKCGTNDGDHVVDHIKPRSKFPLLELDINNMQILCNTCNIIKSNRYFNDYRQI